MQREVRYNRKMKRSASMCLIKRDTAAHPAVLYVYSHPAKDTITSAVRQNEETKMQNNYKGMQFYGVGVLLPSVRRDALLYWSIWGEERRLNDIFPHCNAVLILVRLLQVHNCICCHRRTATHTHTNTHTGLSLYFHPPAAYDRKAAGRFILASLHSP